MTILHTAKNATWMKDWKAENFVESLTKQEKDGRTYVVEVASQEFSKVVVLNANGQLEGYL